MPGMLSVLRGSGKFLMPRGELVMVIFLSGEENWCLLKNIRRTGLKPYGHFHALRVMFVNPKITLEEYVPNVSTVAFTSRAFTCRGIIFTIRKKTSCISVIYDMGLDGFRVLQSPNTFRMRRRKQHIFEFKVNNLVNIYLYENDDLKGTFIKDEDGTNFTYEYMSKETSKIDIVIETADGELFTLIEYEHY